MNNLAEGIRDELRRNRELLAEYEKIGPAGAFGAAMIRQDIKLGEDAQASGNVINMLAVYKKLTQNE